MATVCHPNCSFGRCLRSSFTARHTPRSRPSAIQPLSTTMATPSRPVTKAAMMYSTQPSRNMRLNATSLFFTPSSALPFSPLHDAETTTSSAPAEPTTGTAHPLAPAFSAQRHRRRYHSLTREHGLICEPSPAHEHGITCDDGTTLHTLSLHLSTANSFVWRPSLRGI